MRRPPVSRAALRREIASAGQGGRPGTAGRDGTDGVGVPAGGSTNQVLAKASGTDYDTAWVDPPSPVIEARTDDPASPTVGQLWLRTDL